MEAGLEHLSWAGGTLAHVDLLLIVAEPTAKSLMTAQRTHALATELGIADIALVANRVADGAGGPDGDGVDRLAAACGLDVLARLPDDPAVRGADQAGASPLDHAPHAPITGGLLGLAEAVAVRLAAGVGRA